MPTSLSSMAKIIDNVIITVMNIMITIHLRHRPKVFDFSRSSHTQMTKKNEWKRKSERQEERKKWKQSSKRARAASLKASLNCASSPLFTALLSTKLLHSTLLLPPLFTSPHLDNSCAFWRWKQFPVASGPTAAQLQLPQPQSPSKSDPSRTEPIRTAVAWVSSHKKVVQVTNGAVTFRCFNWSVDLGSHCLDRIAATARSQLPAKRFPRNWALIKLFSFAWPVEEAFVVNAQVVLCDKWAEILAEGPAAKVQD